MTRNHKKVPILDGGKNENFHYQFYVFFNHSDRFSILKNICLDQNMTKIGLIWPEIFNFKVCAILRIYAIFT